MQRLFAVSADDLGPFTNPTLRLAKEEDLPRLMPLALAAVREILERDPLAEDPHGYEARVTLRVRGRRTYVLEENGALVFKVDIGSRSQHGAELAIHPGWRLGRRGAAPRGAPRRGRAHRGALSIANGEGHAVVFRHGGPGAAVAEAAPRTRRQAGGVAATVVIAVLAVVIGLGSIVTVYRIGESGAAAAWTDQFSVQPQSDPGGPPHGDD